MVNLNDSHTFITGGDESGNTYVFDHLSQTYVMGPKLNIARTHHATGIIIDSVTKENIVVVTGGWKIDSTNSRVVDSTEILRNGTWEYGM